MTRPLFASHFSANALEGIHPTAIVSSSAVIEEGSIVGPYAIIGPRVKIGRKTRIHAHAIVDGITVVGEENEIFPFASVGLPPQDLKFRGEESVLEIGHRNIIREYVTLQPGTMGGGMKTVVGDDNLLMASSHVGHDCVLGNHNILANSVALAGHVTVGDRVTIGGLAGIHQFARLGDLSFIGAGAMVSNDVPPFCFAQGDRARLCGINKIGLERAGFDSNVIRQIFSLYRTLSSLEGTLPRRVESLKGTFVSEMREIEPFRRFIEFLDSSTRGISITSSNESS